MRIEGVIDVRIKGNEAWGPMSSSYDFDSRVLSRGNSSAWCAFFSAQIRAALRADASLWRIRLHGFVFDWGRDSH